MEEYSGTPSHVLHPESAPSGKRLGVTRLMVNRGVGPLCSGVPPEASLDGQRDSISIFGQCDSVSSKIAGSHECGAPQNMT